MVGMNFIASFELLHTKTTSKISVNKCIEDIFSFEYKVYLKDVYYLMGPIARLQYNIR
jgi:hypothetical protein